MEMFRIQRLPELLISQIAAGEVVERPANIVKECLENSVDARSNRIELSLKSGGMEEILIVDNGMGIREEDLPLALERHTTSKIRELSDLEDIGTFGFRGEALSSIASVSDVELISRTPDKNSGKRIAVSYGKIVGKTESVAAPVGTSLKVRNLFGQIPARQKFLKTGSTEFAHCSKAFRDIALGNPGVSFFLHHEGKRVKQFPECTREERVMAVLEPNWKPLHIEERADEFSIDAYLTPTNFLQDRGELFLYVNGRPIKSRFLLAAVRSSYLDTLGPHHDPSGVLFLDIRRDWVDVNVHPQKTEVRCLKQDKLYQWCLAVLRKRIAQAKSVVAVATTQKYDVKTGITAPLLGERSVEYDVADWERAIRVEKTSSDVTSSERPATSATPTQMVLETPIPRALRYLGQAKSSYLVCEDKEGLLLVDQHALHEKMTYEKLLKEHAAKTVRSQPLLIPKIMALSGEYLSILKDVAKDFEHTGIELEFYGDKDVAITARPELLDEPQVEAVVKESLRFILGTGTETMERSIERVFHWIYATVACHSVVRANQPLSPTHAQELLKGIAQIELGLTCPHGRPVMFRVPYHSIEKHFKRT